MPTPAKITLSAQELQLVSDTQWILTKHAITGKVYQMLGDLASRSQQYLQSGAPWLPAGLQMISPKIYKGENYRLLPYVMMDYPRVFSGNDVFAIRTMFWWGHFFSITLQLGGTYKELMSERLMRKAEQLQAADYYICIGDDPWQHHFEADNYLPAASFDKGGLLAVMEQKDFLKLAKRFPFGQWDEMPALLENSFVQICALLEA